MKIRKTNELIQSPTNHTPPGLSDKEVLESRTKYGSNHPLAQKSVFWETLFSVVKEPMFILLLAAGCIYALLGEYHEALTLASALLFVAGIDIFQNFRSRKAIQALGKITGSKAKVIRNGTTEIIPSHELVKGDLLLCEEGDVITADATILRSNDFSVNEAIITGESVSVEKNVNETLFQGTLAVRGYSLAKVSAVGEKTTLSGIGSLVEKTGREHTPLQQKIDRFVKGMVMAGSAVFVFVWFFYWRATGDWLIGLLQGLTLIMSVLPEEIPVAFSSFMALGAYRLLRHGIIAKSPKTVETLGAATVICLDKTGTLTQNLMEVALTFDPYTDTTVNFEKQPEHSAILTYAMWASEERPFDPMEKSIHAHYALLAPVDLRNQFHMVKEYPLSGHPPAMTHIFESPDGERIIGCKGAPEGVMKLCSISEEIKQKIRVQCALMAAEGYRVLGVAKGLGEEYEFPEKQEDFKFTFLGLIAFSDPPVQGISKVISEFYDAGLDVKMITGDFPATAKAIAAQTGFRNLNTLTGEELLQIPPPEWPDRITDTAIFARINPETKLSIVNALKHAGHTVCMTGDGVNDAPALKAAHIGIAMGKRGTEVAKEAAGLVLAKDELSNMTEAIFLGRQINENLTKAIRYIISIHIPVILLVLSPILFSGLPDMLFTPVHVIFLELIMGPTCSILYENEKIPRKELSSPADSKSKNLLKLPQLGISLIQGIIITTACLLPLIWLRDGSDALIRTHVFTTLILSNIFLTLVNRSFRHSLIKTIRRKNKLVPVIIGIALLLLTAFQLIPYFSRLFRLEALNWDEWFICIATAAVGTLWIEPIKVLAKGKLP